MSVSNTNDAVCKADTKGEVNDPIPVGLGRKVTLDKALAATSLAAMLCSVSNSTPTPLII